MKSLRLLSLLPLHPGEFLDRVCHVVEVRWSDAGTRKPTYRVATVAESLRVLGEVLDSDWTVCMQEPSLTEIEQRVREQQASMPEDSPFNIFHNGDLLLARYCYAATRILRPQTVIETGVCYGVTSAHILQALGVNGKGALHSIDLPPLGKNANDYVGWLVPQQLRGRWTLHRGTASRMLPELLSEVGEIDLFVHDSLHTYRNMRFEFEAAWPSLRPGGILISDDVDGNAAFEELMSMRDLACSFVLRELEKGSSFGIAVKHL